MGREGGERGKGCKNKVSQKLLGCLKQKKDGKAMRPELELVSIFLLSLSTLLCHAVEQRKSGISFARV